MLRTDGTVLWYVTGVLSRCIDRMEEANHFCDIVLFCIAGSPVCEAHLDKLQPRLEAHGKSISIYYANAKFNLADNGTDLGFDGAEFNEEAKALIDEAVGSFASKMKCAVWDWVRAAPAAPLLFVAQCSSFPRFVARHACVCGDWSSPQGDRFREQEHHLTEILYVAACQSPTRAPCCSECCATYVRTMHLRREYFEGVDGAPEELLTNIKTRLKAVKDASAAAADAGEDESKA